MRRGLAHESVHGFGVRGNALRGHGDPGLAHQRLSLFTLLRQDDGDDVTSAAGARGAPRPVQVCLVLSGRIDMHYQLHIIDVDAAGRDIGGDQNHDVTGGKFREVAITGRLREVPVQINGRNSRLGELLGELAGLMLGAQEQDAASIA